MKRYRPIRSEYRARSHDSAHDASAGNGPELAPPPVHPLIPQGDATMVTQAGELEALIEHLRGAKQFAYDSEFIGELTYIPKLCVIQVASTERVALIGVDLITDL